MTAMVLTMEATKVCKTCGEAKPIDDYYGRNAACKRCYNLRYYTNRSPEYRKLVAARSKASKYGMTLEEMERVVAEHGDLCHLCGKPEETKRKRDWTRGLTMDHDHVTKRFRGMLCSSCNLAIGHAKDDPALLRAMADYVEAFRT